MKYLTYVVLGLFLLSGCTTMSLNLKPGQFIISNIDTALLSKCDLPVKIPRRKLTQAEVEKYWGLDRKNLIVCAKKHGFLGDAIRFRDEQIKGNKPKT